MLHAGPSTETDQSLKKARKKESHMVLVSFTESQIFINHCLLTKIYVERRGNTQMDRGEREREREVGWRDVGWLQSVMSHAAVLLVFGSKRKRNSRIAQTLTELPGLS